MTKKKRNLAKEKPVLAVAADNHLMAIGKELYNALDTIASGRGIGVATIIDIQMKAYVNAFRRGEILRLTDEMPYGKYRGINMEDLIRTDPRYISWMVSHSDTFRIDDEALELLEKLA